MKIVLAAIVTIALSAGLELAGMATGHLWGCGYAAGAISAALMGAALFRLS